MNDLNMLLSCFREKMPGAHQPTDHPGGFYAPLTEGEGIRLCNFKAAPSGYMEYLTCLVAHVAFELEKIRSSYPPIPSPPTQTSARKDMLPDFFIKQGDPVVPY